MEDVQIYNLFEAVSFNEFTIIKCRCAVAVLGGGPSTEIPANPMSFIGEIEVAAECFKVC